MRERSYLLTVVFLAAAMFVGLWTYLRHAQSAAIAFAQTTAAGDAKSEDQPATRPVAEVAKLLRNLKLITVEVRTRVESSRVDESWRGDVKASVAAPARLLYGCDLSEVVDNATGSEAGLRPNLLSRGYTLRVPRPVRLAAEVDGTGEDASVEVGWGRFRDLAGEYQLGLARTGLYRQARTLTLTPAQQREVEQTTREQLVSLVRAFAAGGDDIPVDVEFFESRDSTGNLVTAPTDGAAAGTAGSGK
jgi:hypothetical protein